MGATIYYDGHCPFCTRYTEFVRLREAVGPVRLVDLRSDPAAREALQAEGYDLDEGMVLELEGTLFHGADALNRLALLSSSSTTFNRVTAALFSSAFLAKTVYPVLRAGRNAVLFALGRSRISPGTPNELSAFAIFAHAFGVFGFIDLLYHIYRNHTTPAIWITGALGAYLAVRPRSPRIFSLLAAAMLINGIIRMPASSNHAILLNFTLAAMSAAALYTWCRGRSWTCFMRTFAPVGRCLLVVMYVFGVFHKLNTDFLDPVTSCATALWEVMPSPLSALDATWFRHLAIYGTLVGESIILLGLCIHRTRHMAIVAGIAFHSMLALSAYGYYPAFSTLTICLHLLFISPGAAARIVNAPAWRTLQHRVHGPGILAAAGWMGLLWLFTLNRNSSHVGLLWLPWSLWLMLLVIRHGRERAEEKPIGPPLYSRTWLLNVFSIVFFINCTSPYLGLKNTQAMNMFSNLVHEGGRSNHLVMSSVPRPLPYLDDTVTVVAASGSPFLAGTMKAGWLLPYYGLLDHLDRNPDSWVSFARAGTIHEGQNSSTMAVEIADQLHPTWVRALLHFQPLASSERRYCDLR